MSKCKDCKHWGADDIPEPSFTSVARTGKSRSCAVIAAGVDAACDCSYAYSGDVHFFTDGEFGCVRFEAKRGAE